MEVDGLKNDCKERQRGRRQHRDQIQRITETRIYNRGDDIFFPPY